MYTSSWDVFEPQMGTCGKARSIYKGKVSPTTYGSVLVLKVYVRRPNKNNQGLC